MTRQKTSLSVLCPLPPQDKHNAMSVSELHEALSLGAVADDRRLFLLAAQLGSDGLIVSRNLQAFQDLILQLV